jgi:hypothetical protein
MPTGFSRCSQRRRTAFSNGFLLRPPGGRTINGTVRNLTGG